MPRKIYFVAGEASGDNHGAVLMEALRAQDPDLVFEGRGGPKMKAVAGENFTDWIAEAGVVGLWDVVKKYGYFRAQFRETLRQITQEQPDAVVLIDYPGFNLRLARALHGHGLTKPVIYYISPQVWAWNRGRITHMAEHLDLMLCIFPFEAELYNRSGLRTKFVGHPMIDHLGARRIAVERDANLVGLFPGSRRREVDKLLPILIETAAELRKTHLGLRFEVSAASDKLRRLIDPQLQDNPSISIAQTSAAELMQRAGVGIVASGTATLEAAYFRLPFVLVYKVPWISYIAARPVVKVKFLGMPNLLAGRAILPEFIQHRARPGAIAQAVRRLIDDASMRALMIGEFDRVIGSLGEGGASRQAADAILAELAGSR